MENIEKQTVRLSFRSADRCKDVFEKLVENNIEENKLDVEMTDTTKTLVPENKNNKEESHQIDDAEDTTEIEDNEPWKTDPDLWDPKGLYGLRPQFLKSMNITPPLEKWVRVSNFSCEVPELKQVMELAGNVLMCIVHCVLHRYAKILYSHPLEAIQAISMLNGQLYYGRPLKVVLDRSPTNDLILPKGLSSIGLGLGLDGKPLQNVAEEYEKYLSHKSSFLNPEVFTINLYIDKETGNVLESDESNEHDILERINEFIASTQFEALVTEDYKSKDESSTDTPDSNVPKDTDKQCGEKCVCRLCSFSKNGVVNSDENSNEPLIKPLGPIGPTGPKQQQQPWVTTQANKVPDISVPIGLSSSTFSGANVSPNAQAMPSPMRPGYPGTVHYPIPMHPSPWPGPGFLVPGNGPVFGPQMPVPFRPQMSPVPFRPQMSPITYNVFNSFVGPNPNVIPDTNPENCEVLQFSNLPPSITFPSLCKQIARCGEVLSIQYSSKKGRALATFRNPKHADNCLQIFNKMHLDGHIIQVRYA